MNYEVLIVDDHPLYRLALNGAVAAACMNAKIFEADSVGGLFDALDQHPRVDLLLLDLNLPGANGFNALAHLRGSRPELPIIVISDCADIPTTIQVFKAGALDFLMKPCNSDLLLCAIRQSLTRSRVTLEQEMEMQNLQS